MTTEYPVTKANALIEASSRLTLDEQRLLLLVISHIDSRADVITPYTPLYASATEIADVFDVARNQAYELLQEVAGQLYQRTVTIHRPDPDNPALSKTSTRWISSIDYLPTQGRVCLYLAPKIIPYLTLLAREFTSYRIPHVRKMTSSYAIRLYECLVQWKLKGSLELSPDAFRTRLDVPAGYQRIFDLKAHILEPAVDQINAHSDLWVKWTQRKRGRTIVSFTFEFGVKEHPKPKAPPNLQDRRGWIEKNARPGESWDEARDRLLREERLHAGR